ncbi:Glycosyl transferase family 2 [uncultured archaeon]|nr:Glycosyl transferase family 2 [uncultured archaeon]
MNHIVSIIIPCKEIDPFTIECIKRCKELDYENFEIIVLPDHESLPIQRIKIIPTGEVSPGRKRNLGIAYSDGKYLAFIDNDAYPRKDWLKNGNG